MRTRASRLFVLLSMAFATPAAVTAFETLGGQWNEKRTSYRINANFPDVARSGTDAQVIDILRNAANAWRHQTSADFLFSYAGTTGRSGFNPNDGVNVVSWVNEDGGEALAATLIDGFGSRFTDFDIVYFARTGGTTNNWNGPQDPSSGTIDLGGVGVHEFGHALGLDHTPIQTATMFASARSRGLPLRTLHPDDRDGVEFIYDERTTDIDEGPVISSVVPAIGPASGGNEVIVTGRNFSWTADTTLRVQGSEVGRSRYEVESLGTIRIRSMLPGDVGMADIFLVNSSGDVTLENGYRYGEPPPRLLAVDPDRGPLEGGVMLTITGSGFQEGADVFLGGVALEDATVTDANTITATLPPSTIATLVDLELNQGPDFVSLPEAFTYTFMKLSIEDTPAIIDVQTPVRVLATTDQALTGISFGFSYDPSLVAIDDVVVSGTVAEAAVFAAANVDNGSGVTTFGLVMDFSTDEPNIPIGAGQHIATILVTVPDSVPPGTEITLEPDDLLGQPPIQLFFTPIAAGAPVAPFAEGGVLTAAAGALFVRGDCNGDDMHNLTDAVFHLGYLFRGGNTPPCFDACDSNDDGRMDVSDAVALLTALFRTGGRIPPPFPEPGIDPTADVLECETPAL